MEWIGKASESIKSVRIRDALKEAIYVGMLFSTALMIWKAAICLTGSESPMVVVISGSMEPGFRRGDILFIQMNKKDPSRPGEIVVFKIDGKDIPIVHRVIKVHERRDSEEVFFLTKGDNNLMDDIVLYAPEQSWLEQRHVMGRASLILIYGVLRYMGWVTIMLNENPIMKYVLLGVTGLMYIILPKD